MRRLFLALLAASTAKARWQPHVLKSRNSGSRLWVDDSAPYAKAGRWQKQTLFVVVFKTHKIKIMDSYC